MLNRPKIFSISLLSVCILDKTRHLNQGHLSMFRDRHKRSFFGFFLAIFGTRYYTDASQKCWVGQMSLISHVFTNNSLQLIRLLNSVTRGPMRYPFPLEQQLHSYICIHCTLLLYITSFSQKMYVFLQI